MYNCFFDDDDFCFNIKPKSFICKNQDGYFIKVQIVSKTAIIELMKLGVIPIYSNRDDTFNIYIYVTNSTIIRINGLPLNVISEKYSEPINIKKLTIKEASIKRYSKDHPKSKHINGLACYAKRLILKIT